jgi:hypothetical protein
MLPFLKNDLLTKKLKLNIVSLLNIFINIFLLLLLNFHRDEGIITSQKFIENLINFTNLDNFLFINLITTFIITSLLTLTFVVIKKFYSKNINVIFLLTFTITILYFLKINSLSRIFLIIFVIINLVDFAFSKKSTLYFLNLKFLFIVLLIFQSLWVDETSDFYILSNDNNSLDSKEVSTVRPGVDYIFDIEKEERCINNFSLNESAVLNEYFIVGHAYGNSSDDNIGLSENLLNYFNKFEKNIILTGDIVQTNSLSNLKTVKNELDARFNNYFIAVGNHDLSEAYYEVFQEDLHLISENSVDLIIANFTTYNWKPSIEDQEKINKFIKNSSNDNLIIFSHFLFWYPLVENPVSPNGFNLLLTDPDNTQLDWLKSEGKNLIVISGDYSWGPNFYCEYQPSNKRIFIGNGIDNNLNDKILKLFITENGFYFKILELK